MMDKICNVFQFISPNFSIKLLLLRQEKRAANLLFDLQPFDNQSKFYCRDDRI